jgi:hypothetical protein
MKFETAERILFFLTLLSGAIFHKMLLQLVNANGFVVGFVVSLFLYVSYDLYAWSHRFINKKYNKNKELG